MIWDSGGAFFIHTFGAVFGLFASRCIVDRTGSHAKPSADGVRSKSTGLVALAGLGLTFAILPVFNSGLIAYTLMTNNNSLTLTLVGALIQVLRSE
jgi:hypothetical protein